MRRCVVTKAAVMWLAWLLLLIPTLVSAQSAQDEPRCAILCAPELKVEPTWTIENLGGSRRVEVDGQVESIGVDSVFELVLALDIPTTIPRVAFTFETIFAPFVSDNSVEVETEFNFQLFDTNHTPW